MFKLIKKIIAAIFGTTLLVTFGGVIESQPVLVPYSGYAYQYECTSVRGEYEMIVDEVASTTTQGDFIPYPDHDFVDTDGDCLISVAKHIDKFGDLYFYQMDEERYRKMALEGGVEFNPDSKTELFTPLDLMIKTVQAAIAHGDTTVISTGTTKASSHTIEYTNSAGANQIMLFPAQTGDGDQVTTDTVTFNADSLTEELWTGAATRYTVWSRLEPDEVTGNFVVSTAADTRLNSAVMVYTGVDQVTPFNGTTATSSLTNVSTIVTPDITTTVANTVVVGGAWGQSPLATLTFNTGDNERFNFTGFSNQGFTRNNVGGDRFEASTGTFNIDWTGGGGTWDGQTWILALNPAADAVVIEPQSIIWFD